MDGKKIFKVPGVVCLVLFLIITLTSFQCQEDKERVFEPILFELEFTIAPADSIAFVGDTIWITANIPDSIRDWHTGNRYKLIDFNFDLSLVIRKLFDQQKPVGDQPGATSAFDFIIKEGTLYLFETFNDFRMAYRDGYYLFRVGVIPKAAGVYCFNFLTPPANSIDIRQAIKLERTPDGRERIPVYDGTYVIVNDGVHTNFDLFKKHCRAISLEVPIPDNIYYEQKGSFTFRVVE